MTEFTRHPEGCCPQCFSIFKIEELADIFCAGCLEMRAAQKLEREGKKTEPVADSDSSPVQQTE